MILKELNIDKNNITNELSSIRISLGAQYIPFSSSSKIIIHDEGDISLQSNIVGTFKEILAKIDLKRPGYPLLDENGNCRFLYIPDHTWLEYRLKSGKSVNYNKVHISYCKTLQDMESKDRGDRYSFTTDNSGSFEIFMPLDKKEFVKLHVCKNCLREMSKNHSILNYGTFNEFTFKKFSIDFKDKYPPEFNKKSSPQTSYDYPVNWSEISYRYKTSKNWICEDCSKDCSYNKSDLDTHHINGIKSDTRDINLKALCKRCHKKQPFHSHY